MHPGALLTRIQQPFAPGLCADLPYPNALPLCLTYPYICQRTAALQHEPVKFWDGRQDTTHAPAQACDCAEVLRPIPLQAPILMIQRQASTQADIHSQ